MPQTQQLLTTLVHSVTKGCPVALCVLLATRGSTPQVPGAMMLVHEDGSSEGTIGGGLAEARVIDEATTLVAQRASSVCELDLEHDPEDDDGAICGGHMKVAITTFHEPDQARLAHEALALLEQGESATISIEVAEQNRPCRYEVRLETRPTLLVAGAGHVGAAVARLAVELGFNTVVFDDREDLLTHDRLPARIRGIHGDMAANLRRWPIDANTYVVIVTRGHQHDETALTAVIDSPARYVGMIGSRRKIRIIFEHLAKIGVAPERLEEVHAPIGLPIGAVTVEEIAVSIAAELVQTRRREQSPAVTGPLA